MPLTRSVCETVRARAQRDPAFRDALLWEAADALTVGDLAMAEALLRDCLSTLGGANATTGASPASKCRRAH
jgi:hypothetical protein